MTNLKIVTFNLRTLYDDPYDGVNAFIHRAGLILEKIRKEQADVICFQEASDPIREFLRNYLIGYDLAGHGRCENYEGEGLCIAWRNDVIELFALEQFWLSPTPYVPGSRYQNQSEYPRICPRVLLKHKNMSVPMRFFNVHLDSEAQEARVLGVRQILDKAAAENHLVSCPTFLMGDFNAYPDAEPIRLCSSYQAFPMVNVTEEIGATFHDFEGTGKTHDARGKQIDYIFTDTKTAQGVKAVTKWDDTKNGICLSDHYPVCCELQL